MRCSSAGTRSFFFTGAFTALAFAALAGAASAQPFDAWLASSPGFPTTHGYVEIPHSANLNPTGAFTVEAWVRDNVADGGNEDCRSIAGKNFEEAWWIGTCTVAGIRTLRSFVKGETSALNGGRILVGRWTHVAVTFGAGNRRQYVNGELVATQSLAGPLTTSTDPMRIGSDVAWQRSPNGAIDEVRLWNVARTEAQIRANLNVRITTAQPGLIGVWPLSGNGNNIVGPEDGVLLGAGAGFLIAAVASSCGGQTPTALCLLDRFQVTARWRTGPQTATDNAAQTIPCVGPFCASSGIFWFFQEINWELMVKVLDACGVNDRYWVFNAGLTNVFFRLEVTDVTNGETKIYFNYQGPPAPAITDTSAFDTCPP